MAVMTSKNGNSTASKPAANLVESELSKERAKELDDAAAVMLARNLNLNNEEQVNQKIAAFVRDLQAQTVKDSEGFKACQKVLDAVKPPANAGSPNLDVLHGSPAQQEKLADEARKNPEPSPRKF